MQQPVYFSDFVRDERLHNKCAFTIKDAHVGVVNALRRVILSDIPNVAVGFDAYHEEKNDCVFHVNTTSLHNEFLGHRLSLIPIYLPPDVIDGYDGEQYRFIIDVKNTGNEVMLVTSEHIKIIKADGRELTKEERDVIFPPDPITGDFILITKLRPNLFDLDSGEHLHVEFRARKGIAKQNAAWCPVSLCSYKFVVDEAEATRALTEKLASITDADERDKAVKLFNTLDKQRYYFKNANGDPTHFRFSMESECALTPTYLFDKAFDVLVGILQQAVSPEKYSVHSVNEEQHLYVVTIDEEDHTLGNLLQVLIYEEFIKTKKRGVTYAGYNVPHPLEARIQLKMKFDTDMDVPEFLREVCSTGVALLRQMQMNWRVFAATVAPTVGGSTSQQRRVVRRR
jgi:DNA-directed RNA polymerase subunit L/DNA-directed RNA polymerase alpha subunit